jgi:ABC-type maltose transport system permease subunit
MAAASLAVLPVTIAYLYLQRYLISGIATGATKG